MDYYLKFNSIARDHPPVLNGSVYTLADHNRPDPTRVVGGDVHHKFMRKSRVGELLHQKPL